MEKLATINIKGKDYVQVDVRLAEFRRVHPNWSIETDVLYFTENDVTTKTTIKDENGRIIGTGLAHEEKASSQINRTSMYENAETSSIGRAIAIATNIGNIGSICSADEVNLAIKMQEKNPVPKNNDNSKPKQMQTFSVDGIDIQQALDNVTTKGKRYEELDFKQLEYILENSKSEYAKRCAELVIQYKKEELEEIANRSEEMDFIGDEESPF